MVNDIGDFLEMRDGTHIYVERYKKQKCDTTLIIVSGCLGQCCFSYQGIARMLSKYFNVIIYDQRGILRSDEANAYFSSNRLVDDIEDIRKHYRIKRLILCGHSYGGELVLRYAMKYPAAAEKLVYICPTFDAKSSMENVLEQSFKLLTNQGRFGEATEVNDIISKNSTKSFLESIGNIPDDIRKVVFYSPSLFLQEKDISRLCLTEGELGRAYVYVQKIINEHEITTNYLPYLKTINIPALAIAGDHDPIFQVHQQKCFLKNPYNELKVMKNAGHEPHLDSPEELTRVISRYIQS